MEISYSKKKRPYINFRMRKLINQFMIDNNLKLSHMGLNEKSQFIADEVEKIISANYWIKDKRKDNNVVSINKKVA